MSLIAITVIICITYSITTRYLHHLQYHHYHRAHFSVQEELRVAEEQLQQQADESLAKFNRLKSQCKAEVADKERKVGRTTTYT